MGKSLNNKYGQKVLNSAKKSTIKTASKRSIQKTAEATGDLIGNKIADKISVHRGKACKRMIKIWNRRRCRNKYSSEKIHIPRRKTTSYWRIKGST